jgi:hypothetical protein
VFRLPNPGGVCRCFMRPQHALRVSWITCTSARFTVEHRILTPHATSPPSIAGSSFLLHLVFVLSVIQGSQKWPTLPTTTMAAFGWLARGDGLLRLSHLKSSQSPILSFTPFRLEAHTLAPLWRSTLLQFYLLSQSQHCLSSIGKRSTLLSYTMLFCMSFPLLYVTALVADRN